MNEDSLVVSSSTRTRWCAARACRPPPARASAIAERFGRAAPGRSPAPGGPWSGFCVPLPSPTGAQRSPLCLRRPRPASGQAWAAVSSSSSVQRAVQRAGVRPSAAAQGSPDPAQGSRHSGEPAAHACHACRGGVGRRRRSLRLVWRALGLDFGGSTGCRDGSCAALQPPVQGGCRALLRL